MGLVLLTPPSAEPLSRDEAKTAARIETSSEDSLIDSYIVAARKYAEAVQKRQLVTATWKLVLDRFPATIFVPLPPLQSVSSITYVDTYGTTQTLATTEYLVDAISQPGRIVPAYGKSWPNCLPILNAVAVTFVAGYGAASAVPASTKQAMRLLVAHYYENRGDQSIAIPAGVDAALMLESWGYYTR